VTDILPKEHWETPDWINEDLYQESVKVLTEKGVQYVDKKSYHQMCRWNSGMFYRHPKLANTKWYWRVEPNVKFFCDIDYDVFRWMEDHNKTYGFTINLYDNPESVASLWPETMKFMTDNSKYLHPNNAMDWLQDRDHRPDNYARANGYSTCHFWTNFEIADMSFYRSEAYEAYFNHLDRSGGFFYERWGDAPVHAIALGLFEDKDKIHWFQDIGYQHIPFFNCPNSAKCRGCEPGKLTDGELWLHQDDCRPVWFKVAGKG
jgi:mannosyltransferase